MRSRDAQCNLGNDFKNVLKQAHWCLLLLQICDEFLDREDSYEYLGVVINETLSWNDHVDYISTQVNQRFGILRKIKELLLIHTSERYANSMIMPLWIIVTLCNNNNNNNNSNNNNNNNNNNDNNNNFTYKINDRPSKWTKTKISSDSYISV